MKTRYPLLLSLALLSWAVLALTALCDQGLANTPGTGLRPQGVRESIYGEAILSATHLVMVGEGGCIYRSTDSGTTWTAVDSGTQEALFSVSFPDEQNGWIAGNSGEILHSSDGGSSWSRQDSTIQKDLFAIHFKDARNGIAAGDWGAVVMTEDGGATWQDISLKEDVILYGAQMRDTQSGWVVGELGKIYATVDGGRSWTELTSQQASPADLIEPKSLFCMTEDNGTVFVAGIDGVILYTEDQGKTWKSAKNDSKEAVYGIKVKGSIGWGVGDLGTVLHSEDRGKTWKRVEVPTHMKLSWICAVDFRHMSEPKGFVAGARGLFLKIENDKLSW